MTYNELRSVSAPLLQAIDEAIAQNGGWLPFDRYMALALYAPGLGYYANASRKFGEMPSSGSDFVTAPEMTPLFGRALARQVAEALDASGTDQLYEFGAGSGALAEQLLASLGTSVARYNIVDVSGSLRERQQQRLAAHGDRVRWLDRWPERMEGVVLGNEVLDAMPVQLLHFDGGQWFERGVSSLGGADPVSAIEASDTGAPRFAWSDRPTTLRPPIDTGFVPGTTIERHDQAEAFVATLAEHLDRGAAFFIDYGFPEAEYYHSQRVGGTLMCHRAHRSDTDPLVDVGQKDITAHVDFSGIALAGQRAGFDVLGYTSQARFLMNCGVLDLAEGAGLRDVAALQKLLGEHEMGELFKVIGFAKGCSFEARGFAEGDRTHRL